MKLDWVRAGRGGGEQALRKRRRRAQEKESSARDPFPAGDQRQRPGERREAGLSVVGVGRPNYNPREKVLSRNRLLDALQMHPLQGLKEELQRHLKKGHRPAALPFACPYCRRHFKRGHDDGSHAGGASGQESESDALSHESLLLRFLVQFYP